MSLEFVVAGILLISLTFYALMGGADFGAGVWSLLACGPRAKAQRDVIDSAIGPIWEANHVWLILVIVLLFTAFPSAFALISITLHIPLTLMLIGIVLRGSAFAFRTNDVTLRGEADRSRVFWQRVFGLSSVLTPVFLGIAIGAIASGTIEKDVGGFWETFVRPWLALFPVSVGLLALSLFAFLAAVYLTMDTEDLLLQEDFRRLALAAAAVVAVLAVLVFVLSKTGAPQIHRDLIQSAWRWPLFIVAGGTAVGAVIALLNRRFAIARICAAGEVTAILWGWALAQYPSLVEPDMTIYNSAAPAPTLRLLILALILGALLLFPSLYYLFRVFKLGARLRGAEP